MIKVLFVCLGNICRSPMAQFILQDKVDKMGWSSAFIIDSKATSYEEFGNPPHYGVVRILNKYGIKMKEHHSSVLLKCDYENYDYIIGMDRFNKENILRILGEDKNNKISLLLDYTPMKGDIADPWYTGNFEKTYEDINKGMEGFIQFLISKGKIR